MKWLNSDSKRIKLILGIFLGLSYAIFDGLKEISWLVFFRDLAMAGLLILGLNGVQKIFSKNGKKKK